MSSVFKLWRDMSGYESLGQVRKNYARLSEVRSG